MDMKRHYYEDVQLFTSGVIVFWFSVFLVFLALFPFLVKNYYVYVANYMAINVIVAIGLNLLVGYTGQISLGHAGFFAIGAYGTIVLMGQAHFPFVVALPAAALVAALFGFLLGLPALAFLSYLSVKLSQPMTIAVGGPAVIILVHIVFGVGVYLAGQNYASKAMQWAVKRFLQKYA